MERKAYPSDISDEERGFVAFAILMSKPVVETMLIVHNTIYCYNYLIPNLEFQESFHACYPFRRR